MKKQFFTVAEWLSLPIQVMLQSQRQMLLESVLRFKRAAAVSSLIHDYETWRCIRGRLATGWQHPLAKIFPDYTTERLSYRAEMEMKCCTFILTNIDTTSRVLQYWSKENNSIEYFFQDENYYRHEWENNHNITLWKL